MAGAAVGFLRRCRLLYRRIEPFEEMLHVTAYLFQLPDLEFAVNFMDRHICDRCIVMQ